MCTECCRGKALGEPYDGERHVRFDEGVLETGSWNGTRHRQRGKPAGNSNSPFLRLPRQHPTLQTANVLNYFPKSVQPKAKAALHEIWMAETRQAASVAFDQFIATYQAKYPKASDCLAKDRKVLLAFYDFPAEHWQHIRSTNVIESTFATIRHRSDQAKGCVTRDSMLAFLYKLGMSAEKSWLRLRGFEWLAKVIEGVQFKDGIEAHLVVRKGAVQKDSRVAA